MADSKITQLTALTNSNVDVADVLPIVDVSGGATDKITYQNLMRPKDSVFGIVDDGDITKIVAFQVSGLTTATTRTITVPDADLTLVGLTTTQTLTNKTLTSPQINMASNATGDMYYRDGTGTTVRLAIGTSGQVLQTSSGGIPEWTANPAASDASTTVKGVVEIATTAEITAGTGTGGTGAILVVPASAVGSVGASKIVQFNSSTQYPAADGSLITNISGSGISALQFFGGIGEATTVKTYNNFQFPWVISSDVPTTNFWTTTNIDITAHYGYLEINSASSDATFSIISTNSLGAIITSGAAEPLLWSDAKDVIVEFTIQQAGAAGAEQYGWGLAPTNAPFIDFDDATVAAACFTIDTSGNLYGHTSNGAGGAAHTETAITGITRTNNTTYRIEFNAGVDVKFYVNGILKATNTTNLPSAASAIKFGIGGTGNASDNDRMIAGPLWVAIEK